MKLGHVACWATLVVVLSTSHASTSSSDSSDGVGVDRNSTKRGFLAGHPACKEDLAALAPTCGLAKEEVEADDLAALACAQDRPPDKFDAVREVCEQVLWRFKLNLTKSDVFLGAIEKSCARDSEQLAACANNHPVQLDAGHYMSCLIDQKRTGALKPSCEALLTQVETVIFSDYRLVADFVDKCGADIESNVCGHVRRQSHSDSDTVFYHHSQGTVIECLGANADKLAAGCRQEMLRVAELQGDDFHLDRALYFACRPDRDRLCPDVESGDGRIYKCLLKHKQDPTMSDDCQKQLVRRQRLVSENYRASRGLVGACKAEIKANGCRRNVGNEKNVRLAQILLCLEDAVRSGEGAAVSGQCRGEMRAHRKALMDDYRVSPELMAECRADIEESCGTASKGRPGSSDPGRVIHCLMGVAAEGAGLSSPGCRRQLEVLVKQADVGSDWNVDPVLRRACRGVAQSACDVANDADPASVMSCLMTQLKAESRLMTGECRKTLLEVEYFMARDFALDPRLYRKCSNDARSLCSADDDWFQKLEHDDSADSAKLVFPCLVRYLYETDEDNEVDGGGVVHQQLSDDCADEVERVLEQRAVSVNLHPEIEDSCRSELANFCARFTADGEELECLQDNLNNLGSECASAVATYTRIEARNAVLNPVIASTCHDAIDRHCRDEVSHRDEGAVVQCLIRLRDEQPPPGGGGELGDKCAAAVGHWQLTAMADWTFSYRFKAACRGDVARNCAKFRPRTKADVVGCLSKAARDDVVEERRAPAVSPACRSQLRFQLLQKHSSVDLNAQVAEACKDAIAAVCPPGSGNVLECLKGADHGRLPAACRSALLVEQEEEVLLAGVDHALALGCRHEIRTHCAGLAEPSAVLDCLKEAKDGASFDRACRLMVERRVVQHARDYRLRPRLQKACAHDLPKFCAGLLNVDGGGGDPTADFFEGRVTQCLLDAFLRGPDLLTSPCRREMEATVRDKAMDYRANPVIVAECPTTIQVCKNELQRTAAGLDPRSTDFGAKIEECLKKMLKLRQVQDSTACSRAIAKLIEASNVDIHADPVLYRACAVDVSKFCRDVPAGNGQQLRCLANVAKDARLGLEPRCEKRLRARLEMFDVALRVVPLDGLQDLLTQMSMSPHKNYFALVVFVFFSSIFVVGLLCGRVTKRVRRDLKDR